MGKNLLIFGPPGGGKGTQAQTLSAELGIPHVAAGDILREAVRNGTPAGREAAVFMNRGDLVPDAVVVSMLAERISRKDSSGFLLDGFPRTVAQAEILQRILEKTGRKIDHVIVLDATDDVLMARMSGRRACGICQASYHVVSNPPKVYSICDRCGGTLVQRADDTDVAIRKRLSEYAARTRPVIDFFSAAGWPLRRIDASGDIGAVHDKICAALA